MKALTTTTDAALAPRQRLQDNPAIVYLASLSSRRSQQTMHGALNAVADLLIPPPPLKAGDKPDPDRAFAVPYASLRYAHTTALRARIIERYRPARANTLLSALRGVLKEAWRLGQLSADDYQRAIDVGNVRTDTLPRGRDLDEGEVMALARTCASDDSPAGIRDAAIIGLLATCGLRREECSALTRATVDTSGRIEVRGGKGRKDRTVYAAGGALAALLDWLDLRGDHPGALFHPITKAGVILYGDPITAQAIYKMLRKRAAQAGVARFSPHDFRRTFVGDMLDSGVDISIVSKLAGHSDPKTTARYDRRPEAVKRAAAAKLHYPYQRKRRG